MRFVVLVGCANRKKSEASKAQDIYTSPLFRASAAIARKLTHSWGIVSAKHGLLLPDEVIEPYNVALTSLSKAERAAWGKRTCGQIMDKLAVQSDDIVVILAGDSYAHALSDRLSDRGILVVEPLRGLSLGYRLRTLKAAISCPEEWIGIEYLYYLLEGIGRRQPLDQLPEYAKQLPDRGVYFFFDPRESRTGRRTPRIVRIGTHGVSAGSKATIASRLRTHFGMLDGRGNHRSSVFRQHVGNAIICQESLSIDSWAHPAEVRDAGAEDWLERRVSEYLRSLELVVLPVADDPSASSDRAFVERNTIAAMCKAGPVIDPPSESWLGLHTDRAAIVRSGLWNVDHVGRRFDARLLGVIYELAERMRTGNVTGASVNVSVAPRGWQEFDRLGPPLM